MSMPWSRPDPEVETLVTEMLTRRASDIADDPEAATRPLPALSAHRAETPDLRHGGRRRGVTGWPRQLSIAAAILVVGGGAVAVASQIGGGDQSPGATARIEAATADEPQDDPADPGAAAGDAVGDEAGDGVVDGPVGPTLEEALATLPDGFDPATGSTLWLDEDTTDPLAAAESYLADRLPDLPVELAPIDEDGTLFLFRWSVTGDAQDLDGIVGWVLVRLDPERAGVVASSTEGIAWGPIVRADGRVTVSVGNEFDGELYADVTDLRGQPVPGSPSPDGQGPADIRPFGTAGLTDGADRLDLDVPVGPWPVAVRLQHVGGTWISIAEVVVESTGFATSCGPEPPVSIEVGDRLGPLEPGPSGGSSIEPVEGQMVWHHQATDDSLQTAVEVRWPPDPVLAGRFTLDSFGPDATAVVAVGPSAPGTRPFPRVTDQQHGIVALGPGSADDPCALVQLSVLGDPPTAEWWAGALTAQWSFGFPLTVAGPDLDPRSNPSDLGSDESGLEVDLESDDEGGGLVVRVVEADPADVPRVPARGSCDGLPDDPPRTGIGPGEGFPRARDALAALVALPPSESGIDPPLPNGGYVEYVGVEADEPKRYAIGPDEAAYVLVEVELVDGAWQVVRWEAAPC